MKNLVKRGERKRQRKGGKVLDSQEMALKDSIQEALRGALKRQQRVELATLRLLLSEIKNAEIAQQKPADDNKVLDVITKEVKRRRESIEAFKGGNRSDLVTPPKPLSIKVLSCFSISSLDIFLFHIHSAHNLKS